MSLVWSVDGNELNQHIFAQWIGAKLNCFREKIIHGPARYFGAMAEFKFGDGINAIKPGIIIATIIT